MLCSGLGSGISAGRGTGLGSRGGSGLGISIGAGGVGAGLWLRRGRTFLSFTGVDKEFILTGVM